MKEIFAVQRKRKRIDEISPNIDLNDPYYLMKHVLCSNGSWILMEIVRSLNRSWIYDTYFSLYRAIHLGENVRGEMSGGKYPDTIPLTGSKVAPMLFVFLVGISTWDNHNRPAVQYPHQSGSPSFCRNLLEFSLKPCGTDQIHETKLTTDH